MPPSGGITNFRMPMITPCWKTFKPRIYQQIAPAQPTLSAADNNNKTALLTFHLQLPGYSFYKKPDVLPSIE
ncbi:hypothetical protein EMIT0P228_20565 [Pseudomonas brassicacearum]